jgi:NAD(P)-dependent dehydrogenase (short-subunit alcohol dehydrogenase family)
MTKTFHHAAYATIAPSAELNDQSGRTVLITGSSSGIGFAIAKSFIEAKASQVIITGRNPDSLNRAASELEALSKTTAILVRICNINEENSIKALWERLHSSGVTVDVLVLNAADSDSGPMIPVTKFLPSLRNAFTTNLFANTLMVSQFLDSDLGNKSTAKPKAIVNISSFMAHSNPAPQQAAYSTSKAAFAHTLQLLADEVPASDCQIINVHPGAILTGAVEHAPQAVKDAVVWDQGDLLRQR